MNIKVEFRLDGVELEEVSKLSLEEVEVLELPVVIKYMCIYFHISYKREKN